MSKKINNLIIKHNASIKIAVEKLNLSGKRFLAVVDQNNKYLGSLTDADIRRNILNNLSSNTIISKIYNKKSKYIYDKNYKEEDEKFFLNKFLSFEAIPILNKNKTIKKIFFREEYGVKKSNWSFSCLIQAGGFGERLQPITNNTPKPLISFEDLPYICKLIQKLLFYNVEKIFVSTFYKKKKLIESITRIFPDETSNKKIVFLTETKPLGTGGSLKLIKDNIKNLLVINSDVIFNFKIDLLFSAHYEAKNYLTLVCKQIEETIPYGVIQNEKFKVKKIQEKPIYEYLINSGIYLTSSNIKNFIKKNKKTQMTDLINLLIKKRKKIGLFPLNENIIDYGTHKNLKEAKKNFEKYFYEVNRSQKM